MYYAILPHAWCPWGTCELYATLHCSPQCAVQPALVCRVALMEQTKLVSSCRAPDEHAAMDSMSLLQLW